MTHNDDDTKKLLLIIATQIMQTNGLILTHMNGGFSGKDDIQTLNELNESTNACIEELTKISKKLGFE